MSCRCYPLIRSRGATWLSVVLFVAWLLVAPGLGSFAGCRMLNRQSAGPEPAPPPSETAPRATLAHAQPRRVEDDTFLIPKPTPMPPIPQDELDAAVALELSAPPDHPAAGLAGALIVLSSRDPVTLRADLMVAAQVGEFRLVSSDLTVQTAGGGTVERGGVVGEAAMHRSEGQGGRSTETIRFLPPQTSGHVTISAVLGVKLERELADGRRQRAEVTKQAQLHLLTPVSSARMEDGVLDGFEIGEYLDPLDPAVYDRFTVRSTQQERHLERYDVPRWFYKVTAETKAMRISPNIELGLFAIDYPWKSLGMPQYIALDLNLVRKLEDLLALMRDDGYRITAFKPIYGFRCPAFNLGKIEAEAETTLKEPFSMHQYGRAIDLIIDEDEDGILDDLNGDGEIDVRDAAVIMHYVNILDRRYRAEGRMEMVGGAGLYTHNDFLERVEHFKSLGQGDGQTPYIHVDTRGFLDAEGKLIRWPNPLIWPDGTPARWGDI